MEASNVTVSVSDSSVRRGFVFFLATPLRAMIMETTAGDLLHLWLHHTPPPRPHLHHRAPPLPFTTVCSPAGEVFVCVCHRPTLNMADTQVTD